MGRAKYPARITLAVPMDVYEKWSEGLSRTKKDAIRLTFVELVRRGDEININITHENNNVIYNIVMPQISVSPSINVSQSECVDREYVDMLKEKIRHYKEMISFYRERLRVLERRLNDVKLYAMHGDIKSIRGVLGISRR